MLMLWHNDESLPASDKLVASMKEMEVVIERKEIFICVFGLQNCGKSTLLNAVLGDE